MEVFLDGNKANLSQLHLEILSIMFENPQKEYTNQELEELVAPNNNLFAANKCGPNMAYLVRLGLVVGRKNPNSSPYKRTFWKLGPMADYLKETGFEPKAELLKGKS